METVKKSFNDCDLSYIEKTFCLEQSKISQSMTDWIDESSKIELNDFEVRELMFFRELLDENILHWNEQELSLHFIGPLFSLVNFTNRNQKFNLFAQRFITVELETLTNQKIQLFGKPDGLIASGFREPELPFFAFQEYKKEIDPNGDPVGQVLAAMITGQKINNNNQTIFGCYVNGRDWSFLTLDGLNYCIGKDLSSLTDDIFDIFRILKALKNIIISKTLRK